MRAGDLLLRFVISSQFPTSPVPSTKRTMNSISVGHAGSVRLAARRPKLNEIFILYNASQSDGKIRLDRISPPKKLAIPVFSATFRRTQNTAALLLLNDSNLPGLRLIILFGYHKNPRVCYACFV